MKKLFGAIALCAITACSATRDLDAPVDPIGDFQLGFTVVVPSPNYTQGPASRSAEPEEWQDPLKQAFETRFSRFEGDRFYHLGVIVEAYVLAPPGIPVVLSPKSALIFRLTVVEDITGNRLTNEPEQFTVLEEFGAATVIGSGIVFSKEKQIERLSEMAARRIEQYLREQEDTWFAEKPPLEFDEDGNVILPQEDASADPALDPEGQGVDAAPADALEAIEETPLLSDA